MNLPLRPEVEAAFAAALELPDAEQSAFLAREYPDDPSLRAEVEALLRSHQAAGGFLEPIPVPLPNATPAPPRTSLPAAIGRYRIHRLLGEGAMGVVYEAEQEQPHRAVALKVIQPGLAGPELLRRFELESHALGRLQHPGIAQIYEAGTADSGFGPQPYFAMEFIRGESLIAYAEARRLNSRQRLELLARIGDAVHHAHQRGIIHRDLKPGNILVDETGQPKILDFGVARVTDADAHATRQTDVGRLVGTLAYMSPEQVLADPLELDTRSDVYSLGVVLFELLAGRLPYPITRQLHEAARTIREQEPAPLGSINKAYRGDIETIAAKALDKDKSRRYSSAADFAADLRRVLNDEPIVARPPAAMYQFQKFGRRHKALVAGVAAVFVVLVAGIITSTWEAARARRAEQTAVTESATAKAISDFLQNDLLAQASASTQASPDTKPDPDLKVRTALDRAAERISGRFERQPLVEAAIRQTIGKTYRDLALYSEAQQQLQHALDLRRTALGESHRDTLSAMQGLADIYQLQGKYGPAESLYTKLLETKRRVLGPENPDTLDAMNNLALLYTSEGKFVQAEPLAAQVVEARRRVLGPEHPDTLSSMNNLAVLFDDQGKYGPAEALYAKVLDVDQRVMGPEHPETLTSMNNLALLYVRQRRFEQAEPLLIKVVALRSRVLGADHPHTLNSMNNLGMLYVNQNRYADAEPLFVNVLEVERRKLGDEHPGTLPAMNNLGVLYRNQGRNSEAERLLTRALEIERRVIGEEHPTTLSTMNNLARLYMNQGSYRLAEPLFIKVLDARRRVLGPAHPNTLISMKNLAELYKSEGKSGQSDKLMREADAASGATGQGANAQASK